MACDLQYRDVWGGYFEFSNHVHFSPKKIERIMSWAFQIQIQIVEAVDGKPKDEDPEGVLLVAVQHLCRALISSAADQRSWIL